jgi:hypothetical protein
MLHVGPVSQTCAIIDIDRSYIRTGDRATVAFRFVQRPEYLAPGDRLLFREGRTKGLGIVKSVGYDPSKHSMRRRQRMRMVMREMGKRLRFLTLLVRWPLSRCRKRDDCRSAFFILTGSSLFYLALLAFAFYAEERAVLGLAVSLHLWGCFIMAFSWQFLFLVALERLKLGYWLVTLLLYNKDSSSFSFNINEVSRIEPMPRENYPCNSCYNNTPGKPASKPLDQHPLL